METSELEAQDKGLGYLQNQIALFKDKMSAGLKLSSFIDYQQASNHH